MLALLTLNKLIKLEFAVLFHLAGDRSLTPAMLERSRFHKAVSQYITGNVLRNKRDCYSHISTVFTNFDRCDETITLDLPLPADNHITTQARIKELQDLIYKYSKIYRQCMKDYRRTCNIHVYSVEHKQALINQDYDYILMYRNALKDAKQELQNLYTTNPAPHRFIKSSFALSLLWVAKLYSSFIAIPQANTYIFKAYTSFMRVFSRDLTTVFDSTPNTRKYLGWLAC